MFATLVIELVHPHGDDSADLSDAVEKVGADHRLQVEELGGPFSFPGVRVVGSHEALLRLSVAVSHIPSAVLCLL